MKDKLKALQYTGIVFITGNFYESYYNGVRVGVGSRSYVEYALQHRIQMEKLEVAVRKLNDR